MTASTKLYVQINTRLTKAGVSKRSVKGQLINIFSQLVNIIDLCRNYSTLPQ